MIRLTLLAVALLCGSVLAVGTASWTHTTEADFAAGTLDQVVATNLGDLKLSRAVKTLLEQDPQVSAVYSMAEGKNGVIYAGTGPHGVLMRIKEGVASKVTTIENAANLQSLLALPDGGLLIGTIGEAGRILRIDDPEAKEPAAKELFKAEGVQYIWAMCRTADGNVYASTGPTGQLYELSPEGKQRLLFDSDENNLTALVSDGKDKLYVGSDPNGLVYRVDRKTGESFVLYDAGQTEISGLLIDPSGDIFVATGAAQEDSGAGPRPPQAGGEPAGRPESAPEPGSIPNEPPKDPTPPKLPEPTPGQPKPIPKNPSSAVRGSVRTVPVGYFVAQPRRRGIALRTIAGPATMMAPRAPAPHQPIPKPGPVTQPAQPEMPPGFPPGEATPMPEAPTQGNAIYRIDRDGFVSEVFRQSVTIFAIAENQGSLLVATGGEGQIFELRPNAEETLVVAKVEPKQVMCLLPAKDGKVYLGMANTGGIAAMSSGFANKGSFTSPVMDATQISRFGKIHLDGSIPDGATLTVATRSGNVKEATERAWSAWSDEMPAAQYLQTPSPSARFLQYRLTLTSKEGAQTPVVEDVSVAYQVPNLAPVIKAVKVASADGAAAMQPNPAMAAAGMMPEAGNAPTAGKVPPSHKLNIAWEAADPNGDALTYSIYFRQGSEGPWIPLKEKITENMFEWDTRSVADGKYQVRVVASDALANVPGNGKTSSRVSDPVVIDNTAPVIGDLKAEALGKDVRISLRAVDRTGTIASAEYAVDSSRDWQAFLPSDSIWDSPEETASFKVTGLAAGAHQITVRATDSSGNVAYETVYINTKDAPAASAK